MLGDVTITRLAIILTDQVTQHSAMFFLFYFPYVFLGEGLMHEPNAYCSFLTKITIQLLNLTPSPSVKKFDVSFKASDVLYFFYGNLPVLRERSFGNGPRNEGSTKRGRPNGIGEFLFVSWWRETGERSARAVSRGTLGLGMKWDSDEIS